MKLDNPTTEFLSWKSKSDGTRLLLEVDLSNQQLTKILPRPTGAKQLYVYGHHFGKSACAKPLDHQQVAGDLPT